MRKFWKLYREVKFLGRKHTHAISGRNPRNQDEKVILKKWNKTALKLVNMAVTGRELRLVTNIIPSNGEADDLAKKKLDQLSSRSKPSNWSQGF